MTIWCIVIAVFLVTAVFSMTEMAVRQETNRLVAKHGTEEVTSLFTSEAFLSLLPIAALLFLFVLCAGIFMIAGSMNSNVAQRTQLFGMMRCIGMSKKQIIRYVRLEALNWCKSAIPMGLLSGTAATWVLCAVLKYAVGGEWADMPQLGLSILGIVSGAVVGVLTVLIAAGKPKFDPLSSDGSTEGRTTLIVSDETFRKMTGISDYTMLLVQLSDSATDENIDTLKTLTAQRYKWVDNREYDTHGTYIAFLVCVYSFLVIIALVTILNIVNSISMSVSARIKQYGAMRAVGMSKKQLGNMVKAETLTYSSLGCAIGLVTGLLFSKWLYGFLVTSHYAYAQWHLPVAELIVIMAFFALSVAAGIRAPIKRLNEMSITETIGQL